jgi:hypothetical protein
LVLDALIALRVALQEKRQRSDLSEDVVADTAGDLSASRAQIKKEATSCSADSL